MCHMDPSVSADRQMDKTDSITSTTDADGKIFRKELTDEEIQFIFLPFVAVVKFCLVVSCSSGRGW